MRIEWFGWRGRTQKGVSKWRGAQEGPPRWLGKIFTSYGLVAGSAGAVLELYSLVTGSVSPGLSPLIAVGLIHGVGFTAVGQWAISFRRTIQRLKPVDEASKELGVDTLTIERLAEEKGIKARLNINGRDYYEISDFNEARTLLRGSSVPIAGAETLLRATSANTEAASDNLLRAAAHEQTDPPTRKYEAQEQTQVMELRQ